MSLLIEPSAWQPEGIRSLEPAAERAVKSLSNTLVVAGPGSGKTELLAQRACYLLKTGLCPSPRRILAISFKRDAAKNLRDRVSMRCGGELGRRFDSMTFDAFSKGLLDRFRLALPPLFRPSQDYELLFDLKRKMRELLNSLPSAENGFTLAQIQGIGDQRFYDEQFVAAPLAVPPPKPCSNIQRAAQEVWRRLVLMEQPSRLEFRMIGRLAELIVRTNENILSALRATYAFVFLDEFQDTTNIHYDLTTTAFKGSKAIMTAVGDDKQRIMGWAGALQGIFDRFKNEFSATLEALRVNHRSAPELVRMQHFLIQALDPHAPMPEHSKEKEELKGECRVIVYPDHETEAAHVADLVANWINKDGLKPRDICLLTRMMPGRYTEPIVEALRAKSIKARVENDLQDLLAEPLTLTLMAFCRLALTRRSPVAWTIARAAFFEIQGGDPDDPVAGDLERAMTQQCKLIATDLDTTAAEEEAVRHVLTKILNFIGPAAFRNYYPQYRRGDFYDQTLRNCAHHLAEARTHTSNWLEAVDHFEGADSVPIMTIHKSKGLEYHTIVFVGLEDSALWGFQRARVEETCAFFVAFSRAISRVIFTFSRLRPDRRNKGLEGQSRDTIESLYELLSRAGVAEERWSTDPAKR